MANIDVPHDAPRPSAAVVASKAARGGVALVIRQVLNVGLGIVANIVLARLLTPAEFGIFALGTFVTTFLMTISDVGLGASLIRQPAEPELNEYRAMFSAQVALAIVLIGCVTLASPFLAKAYGLASSLAWLFPGLSLSLLFSCFQAPAAQRLERRLEFGTLARVEVFQVVLQHVTTIGLALLGAGVWSFVGGTLARSLGGSLLINILAPWPLRWHWAPSMIRRHLRFGLLYQASASVSLLKDSITPVLIGLLAGATAVGYVNFAGTIATYPVLGLMVLNRLYLPAFSRLQHDPKALADAMERVIAWTNRLAAPLTALTLALAPSIISLVFGPKWLPALPLVYLLVLANFVVATATPCMGLLNALGHSGLTLRFTLLWMLCTWLFGVPLILSMGYMGFAWANALVQLTNFWLFRVAQAHVSFRIIPNVLPSWILAGLMGVSILALQAFSPVQQLLQLFVYAAGGLIVYLGVLLATQPKLMADLRMLMGKRP